MARQPIPTHRPMGQTDGPDKEPDGDADDKPNGYGAKPYPTGVNVRGKGKPDPAPEAPEDNG